MEEISEDIASKRPEEFLIGSFLRAPELQRSRIHTKGSVVTMLASCE